MLRLYIANLGKYNEGDSVGEWIDLPYKEEDLNDLFVKIGLGYYNSNNEYIHGLEIDGVYYEEYAIHDSETDLPIEIGEYENLNELNEIAEFFEYVDEYKLELLNTIDRLFDLEIYTVMSYKNIDSFLDNFLFIKVSEFNPYYDLGKYWIDETFGSLDKVLGNAEYYFDYKKYGESLDFSYDEKSSYMVQDYR